MSPTMMIVKGDRVLGQAELSNDEVAKFADFLNSRKSEMSLKGYNIYHVFEKLMDAFNKARKDAEETKPDRL